MGGVSNIKVSIIIPVYNVGCYLDECLQSIVGQSLEDIEVICVNDGSTDNSLEILRNLAIKDNRIKVIDQVNSGAAVARNRGLEEAKGEYLLFFDSDDYMSANALQLLYNNAVANGSDIVVGRSRRYLQAKGKFQQTPWTVMGSLVNEKHCFSPDDYAHCIFQIFRGCAWDKLYRREFIESSGLKFQNLRHQNDVYFVFGLMVKSNSISYIDDIVFTHRMHASSLQHTREQEPFCFLYALGKLYGLIRESENQRYMQSFINLFLQISIWSITTIGGRETKKEMSALFVERAKQYGALDYNVSYYYDRSRYEWAFYTINASDYTLWLFHVIPLLTVVNSLGNTECKLFGVLPLYKITRLDGRSKHYLFGVVPFFKLK